MPLQTLDSFTFDWKNQVDKVYEVKTAAQIKAMFDARDEELQTKLNNIINVLKSITDNDSGADNVGVTPITALGKKVDNTDYKQLQEILERIIAILQDTTDSKSGADFIGATPITDLTGSTIQSLLESLKSYIDTTRYSKVAVDALLQGIILGQIPLNSLTESVMAPEMKKQSGGIASYDTVNSHINNTASAHGINNKIDNSKIGVSNGVAGLGSDGKVPLSQLPNLNDGAWAKIATSTLTSSVQQIDFTSILSDYNYFKIIYSAKGISDVYMDIRFNDDTSSLYNYGEDTMTTSQSFIRLNYGANYSDGMTLGEIFINNIQTERKSFLGRYNYSNTNQRKYFSGVWKNTANKINKISILTGSGKFAIGSTFTLWGCN